MQSFSIFSFSPAKLACALCALIFLCGVSSSVFAGDPKSLTAILLVGKSELPDDDFANSVVLVMNNLGPAPIGIVVNRPTRFTIPQLFPDVARLARLHDRVYFGGPVEIGAVWFLARAATPPEHAMQVFNGVYVSADRELLLKLLNRPKPMDGLRIFVGHAGWAPGQLESEIDRGAWTLRRAEPDAIFNGKSEHLWPAPRVPKDSTQPQAHRWPSEQGLALRCITEAQSWPSSTFVWRLSLNDRTVAYKAE